MSANPNVAAIRKFNRFYTNILGLLDQYLLKSDFSLSEVRVLHEIQSTTDCTARILSERLCMDAGYLSRILKQVEKLGLVEKKPSPEDRRSYLLHLTSRGKKVMAGLDTRSDKQIAGLIGSLSECDQAKLVRSMSTIEEILTAEKRIDPEDVSLRCKLRPGDMGYLIHMHGWIYDQENRYPLAFEGYVAKTISDFMEAYNASKDRIWFAEHNGEIVGSIGIIGNGEKAQLRWFLLHPDYRGIGLGKRLLTEALKYCRRKGYAKVFLLTTENQKHSIAMYTRAGFVKVDERENHLWADNLMENTFELDMNG